MRVIPIDPMPKPRMVNSDRWRKRKTVVRYWLYKDELRELVPDLVNNLAGSFRLIFLIPFPKSYSKKKRESLLHKPHELKPDTDNLTKAFLDCLAEEDKHVSEVHYAKFWAEEGCIIYEPIKRMILTEELCATISQKRS